jgi:hypothetical protein
MTTITQVRTDAWPTAQAIADLIGPYFCDKTTIKDAVSMTTIFKAVYGCQYTQTYKAVYRKDLLKRTLHVCRNRMRPFIVPIKVDGKVLYFTPTKTSDMKYYKELLKGDITGCQRMMTACIPRWLRICPTVLAKMQNDKKSNSQLI